MYIQGSPVEYGAWLGDSPVKYSVTINQLYRGKLYHISISTIPSRLSGFLDQLGALFTFVPNPTGRYYNDHVNHTI